MFVRLLALLPLAAAFAPAPRALAGARAALPAAPLAAAPLSSSRSPRRSNRTPRSGRRSSRPRAARASRPRRCSTKGHPLAMGTVLVTMGGFGRPRMANATRRRRALERAHARRDRARAPPQAHGRGDLLLLPRRPGGLVLAKVEGQPFLASPPGDRAAGLALLAAQAARARVRGGRPGRAHGTPSSAAARWRSSRSTWRSASSSALRSERALRDSRARFCRRGARRPASAA